MASSYWQNVQIQAGGRSFELRTADGKPVGDPMIQVGDATLRAVAGKFSFPEGALKQAKDRDGGFFRIYAQGYVPKQVWIGQSENLILLTPMATIKAVSLEVDQENVIRAPGGAMSVGLEPGAVGRTGAKAALSLYSPGAPAQSEQELESARMTFLAQVEAQKQGGAAKPTYRVTQAGTCAMPEQPLPCAPPVASLGMTLTLDNPLMGDGVYAAYNLDNLAASSDPAQAAAGARLKRTFDNIAAHSDKDAILAVLKSLYGIALYGPDLVMELNLGEATRTDGLIRLDVRGLALLGVSLEVTVVSPSAGSLPAVAGVPELTLRPDLSGGLPLASGFQLIGNDGGSLISNDGGGLIGNDGSSLIGNDGSSLIGNDGSSLIGNDGGSLVGSLRVPFQPNGDAKYGLLAYTDWPWPGAKIYAFSIGGEKQWVDVDATSNFTIPASGKSQGYLFPAVQAGAYRLAGIAPAPGSGQSVVPIDAASTAVALWVLGEFAAGRANQSNIDYAGYGRDVAAMQEALDQTQAQAVVSKSQAEVAVIAQAAFGVRVFESLRFAAASPTPAPVPSVEPAAGPPGTVTVVVAPPRPEAPASKGLTPITVTSRTLQISLYDDWLQDGDYGSFYLDDQPIAGMQNLPLNIAGHSYNLNLHSGVNILKFKALNEGDKPTCTTMICFDPGKVAAGFPIQVTDNLKVGGTASMAITAP